MSKTKTRAEQLADLERRKREAQESAAEAEALADALRAEAAREQADEALRREAALDALDVHRAETQPPGDEDAAWRAFKDAVADPAGNPTTAWLDWQQVARSNIGRRAERNRATRRERRRYEELSEYLYGRAGEDGWAAKLRSAASSSVDKPADWAQVATLNAALNEFTASYSQPTNRAPDDVGEALISDIEPRNPRPSMYHLSPDDMLANRGHRGYAADLERVLAELVAEQSEAREAQAAAEAEQWVATWTPPGD